jgi:hypothetical protein
MQGIPIVQELLLEETKILSGTQNDAVLLLSKDGSGLSLPQLVRHSERYLTFFIELLEDHSIPMNFFFYSREEPQGKPAFNLRFGIMPRIRTLICIDTQWLDARVLFPENNEGQLKVVCHGRRLEPNEIHHVTFTNYPCFHDVQVRLSEIQLTDTPPQEYPLPDVRLIDEMGQYKRKDWPQKVGNLGELRGRLQHFDASLPEGYPFSNWSSFGGWKSKKLAEGTGFFSRIKAEGRWWLVDPEGYAFFSMGPDCVVARADCRVDGIEKFMDWLPDREDPEYGGMFDGWRGKFNIPRRRQARLFSFEQANLYRVFGSEWYPKWSSIMERQLKQCGMNTLGNWSDRKLLGRMDLPYVTMLPRFPSTEQKIFRDFPDVFSPEYGEDAAKAAEELRAGCRDPLMIGYFLSNEPAWAFVDNLVLADEVLYNPARTVCRERLIGFLRERYEDIEELNKAWNQDFGSFNDLYAPLRQVSRRSEEAGRDMREFSRLMMKAYVEIPSKACRAADPNHMNLGLRWAWISDPDVVTGWQNFDVFSINCYALDPTPALDNVQKLQVDLPVMIGEFHFGALDSGLTATGLEGVLTQKDRGLAYRYYCERVAKHPYGVGCHYFQCYDQFALGRFDGENYNIGLFDICSQPYREMMDAIRTCSEGIYQVASGLKEPAEQKPVSIPMIAY